MWQIWLRQDVRPRGQRERPSWVRGGGSRRLSGFTTHGEASADGRVIGNGVLMPTILTSALLAAAMMLSLLQAEDAAPAAPPAPAAASAKDLSDSKAVFGIISISKDRKTLTLTDGKGTVTKLKITAK